MKRITSRIWERQTSYNLELGQTFRLVKHLKLNEKFVYIFLVRGIRAFKKNFLKKKKNFTVRLVRISGRGRFRMGATPVYLWLIHVDVWQKSSQYCKVIILLK